MRKSTIARAFLGLLAVGAVLAFVARPVTGVGQPAAPALEPKADHRDGSLIIIDPAADLADVYAFLNPTDNTRVVLAMTVNPFQAPGNGQFFSPDVLYQFKIDNTDKAGTGLDAVEDLVIQVTFTKASDDQQFSLIGPVKPKKTGVLNQLAKLGKDQTAITGAANGTVVTNASSGIKVFAGLREDPFFFDLIFGEKAAGVIQGPAVGLRTPGVDFFAGFNVSILAVELPVSALKGPSGNKVRIWATTSRSSSTKRSSKDGTDDKNAPAFVQIERMGLPTVNVVLTLPKPFNATTGAALGAGENQLNSDLKDRFNKSAPADDPELFRQEVVNRITQLSGDAAYAATTADTVILPDTLTLDLTSTAGFPNGRAPADDVIDAVLNIVTKGGATTDNLPANDSPFLTTFPFFAAPYAATKSVPARDQ